MPSDGNGLVVETVTDRGSKEHVERYTSVRSVSIPDTQGMVRLSDITDLLREQEDVPAHAIYEIVESVEADPSMGGHITIQSPGRTSFTASFDRVDIYAPLVHDARGASVCGPEETWIRVVIPRDLNNEIHEATTMDASVEESTHSTLVENAIRAYLDTDDSGGDR